VKEIILDITKEGEIKIETRGFKGKTCVTESQFLKDLLGTETERSLTPTYWEKEEAQIKKYLPLCG